MRKRKLSTAKKQLWELCKEIIRKKYGNTCYTCGVKGLEGSNWHTGHMIPKGSLSAEMQYDLRLLRPQCYNCNINHGGMGADFERNMRKLEGNNYVEDIFRDRNHYAQHPIKADIIWCDEKISKYRTIRETL